MTKIARPGSEGNMRLLKEYGGGSTPPRQHFATGGAVRSGGNPALDEGLSASGEAARPNLSRAGRKMKKDKDKDKAKTNINIVVMGKDKDAPPPAPGPMAAAGPMAPPPMPMPPKPPMAGPDIGPPMPMRASGGRVSGLSTTYEDKTGKTVDMVPPKRLSTTYEDKTGTVRDLVSPDASSDNEKLARKNGGRTDPLTRSHGGPAKPPVGIDDGAGGGKGRLEKIKSYGK